MSTYNYVYTQNTKRPEFPGVGIKHKWRHVKRCTSNVPLKVDDDVKASVKPNHNKRQLGY